MIVSRGGRSPDRERPPFINQYNFYPMNRKILFFGLPPLLLLGTLVMLSPKQEIVQNDRNRNWVSHKRIKISDTLSVFGDVDDLCFSGRTLWMNKRTKIACYDLNSGNTIYVAALKTPEGSFSGFIIRGKNLYLHEINSPVISRFDLEHSKITAQYTFRFPVAALLAVPDTHTLVLNRIRAENAGIERVMTDLRGNIRRADLLPATRVDGGLLYYSGTETFSGQYYVSLPFYKDSAWVFDEKYTTLRAFRLADASDQDFEFKTVGNRRYLAETVNRHRLDATALGNLLLVVSNVSSENQTRDDFVRRSTIDAYAIDTGTYLFSFYLPSYKKSRISQLAVSGDSLLAAAYFNSQILLFDLRDFLKNEIAAHGNIQ